MALRDYLKLLDWMGRQGRLDRRKRIFNSVAPILKRLGIGGQMFCDLVGNFRKKFGRSAGSPDSLKQDALQRNCHWSRSQREARDCFASN